MFVELISIDKSIRCLTGITFFSIIWCDNQSSKDYTEINRSHKLKSFDQSLRVIKEELREREKTGKRKIMDETHGDYIKQCVYQEKFQIFWI